MRSARTGGAAAGMHAVGRDERVGATSGREID